MSNLNINSTLVQNETKRIFDYFIVTGLPPKLTAKPSIDEPFNPIELEQHDKFLYKNLDIELNRTNREKLDPIVDIAVMNRTLNEGIPNDYECLWQTPTGHPANLCSEKFNKNEMYLLIRRGLDKPPIADIGICYEGDIIVNGCSIIRKTIGENSANLNTSSLYTDKVFLTYRRLSELACNSLAVVDICVINKSKGETAPHSFFEINKNLNIGLFGPSLFLCYKKAWIPAPHIKYIPSILYRYPRTDHFDIPFPSEIASFGLPIGANIESWPKSSVPSSNNVYLCNAKPLFSTFVLNVNSDDGSIIEKVYGSSITFYEDFDENFLNDVQCSMLNYNKNDPNQSRSLHSNKSLIILSRDPLFETYKSFLIFIFNKYKNKLKIKSDDDLIIPIERYLSFLIYEVPFPSLQKPHVLVHLTEQEDDILSIKLPTELVLPQSGASFFELLYNLEVENSINAFLFAVLQKNIIVHSLRRQALTSVVEAISSMIFPFIWRYSYLPMCPLNLCQLIEAPGSFIIGMDTRFFDMFDPPQNVICIDLDTNTISLTAERSFINSKILPKRIYNHLKNKLTQILNDIIHLNNDKKTINNPTQREEIEFKKRTKNIELSIREAFLKAMAHILMNYRAFLRTVTRRPDVKAIDRNISKFFDIEGFLRSKDYSSQFFYKELTRTQLFYDCIMNLSFTSELEPMLADSYAFFSEVCSKINQNPNRDDDIRLILLNNSNNSQTIVMLPPILDAEFLNQLNPILSNMEPKDIILNGSAFIYDENQDSFPKLKSEIYLDYNSNKNSASDLDIQVENKISENSEVLDNYRKNSLKLTDSNRVETQSNCSSTNQNNSKRLNKFQNTPIGVRSKAEKIQSIKKMESRLSFKPATNYKQAHKNYNQKTKLHAYCFLSNAYALWFIYLPELIKECNGMTINILNYAYVVLTRMQKHKIIQPDEICYRTMMQLCLIYKLPTLAIKTWLHIRKYRIEISPITYSYYNKALTETTNWPSFDKDRWAKIRLIFLVAYKFRENLKLKREREIKSRNKRTSKIKINKKRNSRSNKKLNNKLQFEDDSPIIQEPRIVHQLDFKNLDKPEKLNSNVENLNYTDSLSKKKRSHSTYLIGLSSDSNDNNLVRYSSVPGNLDKARKFIKISFKNDPSDSINNKLEDPLSYFLSQRQNEKNSKNHNNDSENVTRQLITKKLFENKSDFIYAKNSKIEEKSSQLNDNVSYDSDMSSDNDYDSDEDYENDDEDDDDQSVDFEDEDDVEVDKYYYNGRSEQKSLDFKSCDRSETNSLSQSKGSTKENTIEIENILINSTVSIKTTPDTNDTKKKSFFSTTFTPFTSSILSKQNVSHILNKLESSSSKLKDVGKLISDKSIEIKDSLISQSSQNEIASKFKSFSNYNIKTAQALTDIVKSRSNFSFNSNSDGRKINGKSNHEIDLNSDKIKESFDSEPLPNDESYEQFSLDWWGINNKLFYLCNERVNDIFVEVQMTTCNYCENCKSFLYDEEIMSGWTLNDSDLNIKCLRCSSSLVPKLYVKIKDMENMKIILEKVNNDQSNNFEQNFKQAEGAHPLLNSDTKNKSQNNNNLKYSPISSMEFTVQYLSPLVVRKELENIISHNILDNEEASLINEKFMNEHNIIFWNLIWYFKRIGVDCSHLETVLLNSRLNFLLSQNDKQFDENFFYDYKSFIHNLSNPQYNNHPHVRINCMWDNLKLKNEITHYEIPLYINWLINNYSSVEADSKKRLITVLTLDELKAIRKTNIKPTSLSKLFELIIRNIKESEISIPITNLIREKFTSKVNYSSIYREILYFVIIALERELIDLEAFDTEFKMAFKDLTNKTTKQCFSVLDQPPNYLAVWCRRLFSPLLI